MYSLIPALSFALKLRILRLLLSAKSGGKSSYFILSCPRKYESVRSHEFISGCICRLTEEKMVICPIIYTLSHDMKGENPQLLTSTNRFKLSTKGKEEPPHKALIHSRFLMISVSTLRFSSFSSFSTTILS